MLLLSNAAYAKYVRTLQQKKWVNFCDFQREINLPANFTDFVLKNLELNYSRAIMALVYLKIFEDTGVLYYCF